MHGALQRLLGDLLRVDEVTVVAADARLDVTVRYAAAARARREPQRVVRVSGAAGRSAGAVP